MEYQKAGIGVGIENGHVIILLPKNVTQIAFTPDQAIKFADLIETYARGIGSEESPTET